MADADKKVVKVGSKLSKYIGSKAPRDKKLQAASMQAEFTLADTLIMLCYLGRDPDPEISALARQNLIPSARAWYSREDRPDLPDPVREVVMKVIEKIGLGAKAAGPSETDLVFGNIGLLGLGEIIQAVDHNNRTVSITLRRNGDVARVFTDQGKVVGAVCGHDDGLDALYRTFGWADAAFEYCHGTAGDFKNRIRVNTLNLVMDALEYAPEQDPFDSEASFVWKVEGHLRVMNIFEIAEIFEMNSKRATCGLRRANNDEGTLYFGNGRIINATLGEMTGMDAACHLLAWPNAMFEIRRGSEDVEEVIHIGMQTLIIEAMRLLDEGVTADETIASEIEKINQLFDGQDVVTLPVLDRVRLVFGENEQVREALELDTNPLVRKAVKVKISKTIHRYLLQSTPHDLRLKAAQGRVPLSTSEKLVLLSYLSHDEVTDIRDMAKRTLMSLESSAFRKGFGGDLHPAVMDFLVREAVQDETIIRVACVSEGLMAETAMYVLENWKSNYIYQALLENTKLLERSPEVTAKLAEAVAQEPAMIKRIEILEASFLKGDGEVKVEGPLCFCGIGGLFRAAKHGNRSGTIVLEKDEMEGRVYVKKGKLIGAYWDSIEGIPALEAIVRARGVKFRFVMRTHFHVENLDPSKAEEFLATTDSGPYVEEYGKAGIHIMSGHLEAMDLFETLTSVEGTPVPLKISVNCEEGNGEICVSATRVLHAHVKGKEGPYKAMAAMLSWSGIRFIVRRAHEEFPCTVDKSVGDFFTESLKEVPEELKQTIRPGELPEWELSEVEFQSLYNRILNMGVADKIKLAFLGNKEARELLVRDPNRMVALSVVKSPKIQEDEIEAIAKSRSVAEDVLRQIAGSKEFLKSYSVKHNLVANSKTPVPIALKLLPHIKENDLRRLAKSKDVSSVVATQARRLLRSRGSSH